MFGKNKHQHDVTNVNCLNCQYEQLIKNGKAIIDAWDKKPPTPPKLVVIQKQLAKLKVKIDQHKNDEELKFCAQHPEIFEFLPLEIL